VNKIVLGASGVLVLLVVFKLCIVPSSGLFCVYLITPPDLTWHISFSPDRVLLQLWPATLFACFSIFDFPVDWRQLEIPISDN
jgi:hypothetical protein